MIRPRLRPALLTITAICWIGQFVATHLPAVPTGRHLPSDKTLHYFAYLTLGVLIWASLATLGKNRTVRAIALGPVMLAYAAFDEITQPLVGRHADPRDWLFDAAGLLTALLICEALRTLMTRRNKPAA